jgi:hypothetical protein
MRQAKLLLAIEIDREIQIQEAATLLYATPLY